MLGSQQASILSERVAYAITHTLTCASSQLAGLHLNHIHHHHSPSYSVDGIALDDHKLVTLSQQNE